MVSTIVVVRDASGMWHVFSSAVNVAAPSIERLISTFKVGTVLEVAEDYLGDYPEGTTFVVDPAL